MAVEQIGGQVSGIVDGLTVGTSSSLISVYGATPVVQASAISTTDTTAANMASAINSLIAACKNFGIIKKT
jgi:bifunctional ADP-heptose synthase (sugar kinase/adenylyltransferase)